MGNKSFCLQIITAASTLDKYGFYREADAISGIMTRIAQLGNPGGSPSAFDTPVFTDSDSNRKWKWKSVERDMEQHHNELNNPNTNPELMDKQDIGGGESTRDPRYDGTDTNNSGQAMTAGQSDGSGKEQDTPFSMNTPGETSGVSDVEDGTEIYESMGMQGGNPDNFLYDNRRNKNTNYPMLPK